MANPANPGTFENWITATIPFPVMPPRTSNTGVFEQWITTTQPFSVITGTFVQQYSQTMTGALTPAGAVVKSAQKSLSGGLTPTGAALKSVGKTLSGALTPSGGILKSIGKILAGMTTPFGRLVRPGILLEGFETNGDWTTSNCTVSSDTTNKTQGSQGLKLTMSGAVTATATKTISRTDLNLYADCTTLDFYVDDPSKITNLGFYISSSATPTSKSYNYIKAGTVLVPGWNRFVVTRDDWTNTGTEDWTNTMIRIRVRVVTNAATFVTFDNLLVGVVPKSQVCFTFDDAWPGVHANAFPIFQSRGMKANRFVTTGAVGTVNKVTWAELQVENAAGWNICNHTQNHVDLNGLSQADAQTEITAGYNDLVNNSLGDHAHYLAYPLSVPNATTIAAALAVGCTMGRLGNNVGWDSFPAVNIMTIGGKPNPWPTTLATVEGWIDTIKAYGGTMVIFMHNIVETPSTSMEWATADVASLLDYIIAQSIPIVTLEELLGGAQTFTAVLAGAVTFVGTLVRQTSKTLVGGLTPAGALVRRIGRTVIGGLTPAGALVRSIAKSLAGSLTPSGALIKRVGKILSGGLTPSGVLSGFRAVLRTFSGAITPVGTLVNQTKKTLVGSLTPTGGVIKNIQKIMSGAITPSGLLTSIKGFFRTFSGAITPSGVLVNQTKKTLIGIITPVGILVKNTKKTVVGAITPTGTLSGLKAILRTFSGAITPAGVLIKNIKKTVSGEQTLTGTLTKSVWKTLTGIVNSIGSLIGLRSIIGRIGTVTITESLVTIATIDEDLVTNISFAYPITVAYTASLPLWNRYETGDEELWGYGEQLVTNIEIVETVS